MNSETSKKPVESMFSLKALIQANFLTGIVEPVEDQLRPVGEKSPKKARPVRSLPNQLKGLLVHPSASENPAQKAGQKEGGEKSPCERIRQDFDSPLPPMKAVPGGRLKPDYAAFCPDYFRGCFACPDFLRDRVRFCRKWNRTFNGVDVVELEIIDGADASPLPEPALMEEDTGRGWWTYGREVNGMVNTVDRKKGEVLTS